ncbi:MAG: ABC transporter ATP-binding protein [Candidatus Binataceae bacterium]|nr:ABC transporter ATP-binding protein [Candidatus Binataceae bacterium]
MSESPLLDVKGLCAAYGRSQVLFDVSVTASPRGAIAVLGRNGAGKTTLMKTIVGELATASGAVMIAGREATHMRTERRVRLGLGYVPQEFAVFGRLSVRENLDVGMLVKRDSAGLDRVLAMFPKLRSRLNQTAGTLSGGERKMLAIGRALLANPSILLLDEPTEGVWIGVVEEIAERLRDLAKEICIVLVEQHLSLALNVANQAYVLDRGRVVLEGASQEIRDHPKLLHYLAP